MTAAEFRRWRVRCGLTQREAAEVLGLGVRMVGYYEAGREIPKAVGLACAALAAGLVEWGEGEDE